MSRKNLLFALFSSLLTLWLSATGVQAAKQTLPVCNLSPTTTANEVNYALACDQSGWYNLLFGDGGNTNIESGTMKLHSFSCSDNIVDYTYTLETLDATKLLTATVHAGCANEVQQPVQTQACSATTDIKDNHAEYVLTCSLDGFVNLMFGDGGNTNVMITNGKSASMPHDFSCDDNTADYPWEILTLDGASLAKGNVEAGCANEEPKAPLACELTAVPSVNHVIYTIACTADGIVDLTFGDGGNTNANIQKGTSGPIPHDFSCTDATASYTSKLVTLDGVLELDQSSFNAGCANEQEVVQANTIYLPLIIR